MTEMAELTSTSNPSPTSGSNLEPWKQSIQETRDAMDTFYLTVMGFFVFFMHFGFAFLEAGSVRQDHTISLFKTNPYTQT